jgi:hypothetical protein
MHDMVDILGPAATTALSPIPSSVGRISRAHRLHEPRCGVGSRLLAVRRESRTGIAG